MQNKGQNKSILPFFRQKERRNIINNKKSKKEWLHFDEILEEGIIKRKNSFIKIIKVLPINYDLKSNLEKEAILNSYKLFLKTCEFNIQILIQSKKEDLSKYFYFLREISKNEKNENIINITNKYIEFIKKKSNDNKSSLKLFYILIKYNESEDFKSLNEDREVLAINYLNEAYFKIKETLSRCGNIIYDVNTKDETEEILLNFFEKKL